MRQFVVSEAPVSRVAQHVRETVEEAGGIVANHTAHKTEFDHLDLADETWRRAGYVGTYQRFKEKPVQVRIRVWAQWPRRLLTGSIYTGFALALVFFLLSIVEVALPPNWWIFTALPILAVVAAAFLMYTSSIADSEAAEATIESRLVDRLTDDEEIPGQIYDVDEWEAYRERVIDEARDEAREQVPHGGSRVRGALAGIGDSVSSLGSEDEEPAAETDRDATGEQAPEATDEDTGDEQPQASPEAEAAEAEQDDSGLAASVKQAIGLGDEEPTAEEPETSPDAEDTGEGETTTSS